MKFFRSKRRPRVDPVIADHTRRVQDSGLFDAEWYRATYPELAGFGPGPLAHFCEYGLHEHRDPGPNFDTRRYLDAVPEAGTGPLPPFLHAIEAGEVGIGCPVWLRDDDASLIYLIRTSGLFDEAWYRDTYPDVARGGWDALAHYLEYGAAELRDPGPAFDAEHYALTYPRDRETFPIPLVHYLRLGLRRGHRPTGVSRYERWLAVHDDLEAADLERIAAEPVPATVHCIVVVGRDGAGTFVSALAGQAGASWCAMLLRGPDVDGASWKTIVAQVAAEPRIACVDTIAEALAGLADGEIVLLASGGSRLRPHACHAFAAALGHGAALGAYSDHDRIDGIGARHAPVFTPAMSPVLMRQVPYAGPVIALRIAPPTREMLAGASGRLGDPDRAWADLLLGLDPARVIRIPLILHHRAVDEAVPPSRTNQPVPDPSRNAAEAPDGSPEPLPTVRIVIPTRDRSALLRACIDSVLTRTEYPSERYRIVIVDNGSSEDETARYFAEVASDARVRVVASPGPFNFSEICNAGAAGADEDILVFLNNDTTVRQPDWLRRLAIHAARPEAGAVGARLLYPSETVQHGGVVLGIAGVGAHALVDLPEATARALDATREMSAVTGACLAIRRSVFVEIGGFDPLLRIDYNDVDLCCAAQAAGYRNLYVAEPLLLHHESLSRGASTTRADQGRNVREAIRVRRRHAAVIRDDPSYNPNLSRERIGGLAVPPRVVPPWRRPPSGVRRVLLLSAGDGIGRWVADQAAFLTARGFEVILGGPDREDVTADPNYRGVQLVDPTEAAVFATREGVDAVVAHTAPFFAVTQHLGRRPLVYCVDHGDAPPGSGPDRDARADAILDKRYHASLARRVFSTSHAARDALFGQEAVLLAHDRPSGAAWSDVWAERRPALRDKFGFTGRFVVIGLFDTEAGDARDNGIEDFVALATEYPFTDPALEIRPLFVAAGRSPVACPDEPTDLVTFVALSDAELFDLLAASDLYLTPQRRQGVACGIALALAMGLPVVASEIAAHRAYPLEIAADLPGLYRLIVPHAESWHAGTVPRTAVLMPGADPLAVLADTIALDLDRDFAEHWI
ncbi:glycosyltransferase [Methylobacterium sp. WL12]|uniref:glycosyltransferase n=1 Tax=Methylobacterium sp. WL12 TaxID=2603890 RepID=UPI0011C9F96B|nr:glycosyltransferase [Methylobacterium sp. WL12]TXM69587.1 glycosyltransferase [Methylobacterium sp. WL12]